MVIGNLIGAVAGVHLGIVVQDENVFGSIVISSVLFVFLLCFELKCEVKKTFQLLGWGVAECLFDYQFGFWLSVLSVGLLRIFV